MSTIDPAQRRNTPNEATSADAQAVLNLFKKLESDKSITVHRHFQVGEDGVRYDKPWKYAVAGNDVANIDRFKDAADRAGRLLYPELPLLKRHNWFNALFDCGVKWIKGMDENAAAGHCWLPDAAYVSVLIFRDSARGGWLPPLQEGKSIDMTSARAGRAPQHMEPSEGMPQNSNGPGKAEGSGNTTPVDQRDTDGFIMNPSDISAYVPTVKILANHTPDRVAVTAKQLTAVLDTNKATIRQHRPRCNRRSVHMSDWLEHVESTNTGGDGDRWASPDEVEARKAAILSEKARRK
jgi:hypothetical protein